MLAVEELLFELGEDHDNMKDQAAGLPPGFRFHPTDEELITFYLASKVFSGTFSGVEIAELDLNRCEPWDLPDVAKMGEREWYFFSLRDRKYPTGVRTNRATGAGYWKATGKDREVYSTTTTTTVAANGGGGGGLLGMKKTLVFYKGRAPRGEKTKWVMHEYRLDGHFSIRHTSKEEWVICRIFHKSVEKKNGVLQFGGGGGQLGYYTSLPPLLESPAAAATATTTFLLESGSNKEIMIPSMETNMIQNYFLHEENDLKSLLNAIQPSFSPIAFAMPISTTTTATATATRNKNQNNVIMGTNTNMNNQSSPTSNSVLFKSFLSFQEQSSTIPKQCKTEHQLNFSHLQLPPVTATDNFNITNWMDKIHHNPCPSSSTTTTCQNPLFFEMDCNIFGVSETTAPPATADTTTTSAHDMSTSSTAFNFDRPSCFHMTLDPSIPHLLGQSWPLDHP